MQEYAEEVVGYDATAYAQPGMEFAQPGAAGAVMDAPQVPLPLHPYGPVLAGLCTVSVDSLQLEG